jgi:hypothetical protein
VFAAGGHDREAVGAWQTSLVSESDARVVYDVLADAFLRLIDSERALGILTEARERWPDDDLFLPRLAAAQALTKRLEDALKTLGPHLDRHPDDTGAIMLAARVLFDRWVSFIKQSRVGRRPARRPRCRVSKWTEEEEC